MEQEYQWGYRGKSGKVFPQFDEQAARDTHMWYQDGTIVRRPIATEWEEVVDENV